jgi:hypothetical protein
MFIVFLLLSSQAPARLAACLKKRQAATFFGKEAIPSA